MARNGPAEFPLTFGARVRGGLFVSDPGENLLGLSGRQSPGLLCVSPNVLDPPRRLQGPFLAGRPCGFRSINGGLRFRRLCVECLGQSSDESLGTPSGDLKDFNTVIHYTQSTRRATCLYCGNRHLICCYPRCSSLCHLRSCLFDLSFFLNEPSRSEPLRLSELQHRAFVIIGDCIGREIDIAFFAVSRDGNFANCRITSEGKFYYQILRRNVVEREQTMAVFHCKSHGDNGVADVVCFSGNNVPFRAD
jgi:hypothetical protein